MSYSELSPDERATADAAIAEMEAQRPEASEAEIVPTFSPGVIFFADGQYRAVSPDIATAWPWIERYIATLFRLLPLKHRTEYWLERIERGATLALAFVGSNDLLVRSAGILNLELAGDGKRIVMVAVCTFEDLDLKHASHIAETVALVLGAEQVQLWTPVAVPVVTGYRVEGCFSGQLQVTDIEPRQ